MLPSRDEQTKCGLGKRRRVSFHRMREREREKAGVYVVASDK